MLLRVRKNAQITLPAGVRKAAHLEEGDILDVHVEQGTIILTPKKLIDKSQAWFWSESWQAAEKEAEQNIAQGEVNEFESIDDLLRDLHKSGE